MSLHSPQPGKRGSADGAAYKARFRRHCLVLLRLGYECIRSKDHSQVDEDTITQNLVIAIRQILKERTGPRWTVHYFVHDQGPVSAEAVSPKERPKIDIEMESNHHDRPLFHFEAKRLRKDDSHSVSNFVGPPGLGGFLEGSYSPRTDVGGMLGYVQTETPDHWQKKIWNKLSADRKSSRLSKDSTWNKQSLRGCPTHLYLTCHLRDQLGKIEIYHSFLDFTTISKSNAGSDKN